MADIDWGRWLRPGDRLVTSHLSSEPSALVASLARWLAGAADPPQPLHLLLGVPFSTAALALPETCAITTFGGMGSAAALARQRRIDISPLAYGATDRAFEQGLWRCDVALVSLGRSPTGGLYVGASHGPVLAAARQARHVIAQVSSRVPCLPGGEWPADLPLADAMEVEDGPVVVDEGAPGATEAGIARHAATLVRDGDCLQIGIGALPAALLQALHGHRHLGVHSGMVPDALRRLIDAGVADGSRKPFDTSLAVTGSVCGTAALYEAVRQAPGPIVLRPPARTHDAAVVAALQDIVCLNSAIEVDLLGAVNAEAVADGEGRWRHVGGVGGLPDFVRGALAARNGRSVIALPSRTPHGRPRIVARLAGPCTVPACDADVVVTEHGVAHLRDATLAERVQRMIAVAHEADRDALRASARALGLV